MAGFHDVVFPLLPDMGAGGGPGFHTTILTLASGFEQRNIDWSISRSTYDVGATVRSDADLFALQNFFYARNGKAYGFLYFDPADSRAPFYLQTAGDLYPLQTLFTTNGATASFQLFKIYGDGANTFTRIIKKPAGGSVNLYNNTVLMTDPTDFTYSTTTGIVTLSGAVAATSGRAITGAFQFYTPVRFDIDDLKQVIADYGVGGVPTIPLIEVRLP